MPYAVIDRRQWKVVEVANYKKNLHSKGLIVDTHHLERCPPAELISAYIGLVGKPARRKPVKTILAELAEVIETSIGIKTTDSLIEGPVSKVRHICETMRGSARKDVIAACVAEGINEGTARTQYQKWFKGSHH